MNDMSFFLRRLFAGLLVLAAPLASAQRDARQAFDLALMQAPTAVVVDGKTRLVYELHLTNFAAEPLRIERVEVLAEGTSSALFELQGKALAAALGRPGAVSKDGALIAPGLRAVVYFDFALDDARLRPLRHRIAFAPAAGGATTQVEGGEVVPREPAALALGAPLRGGPWIAIYSSEWERGHRRVLYAIDGRVRIPGRHAIDWVKLDAHGKQFAHDGKQTKDWFGYGADVLAVADATVAALRDDVAEPPRVSIDNPRVPIADASGNYVALDLGDGRYAFYEHLKPGSIQVKAGERVRRGQTIGALGYTGESSGPHLHFHLADAPATLAAEGLPYAIEAWRALGGYERFEAFDQGQPWSKALVEAPKLAFPAPLAVVEFPPAKR